MRDEELAERIRQGMAGWRGQTDLPSEARFASRRGSPLRRLVRPLAGVAVAGTVFIVGISAALAIQTIRSLPIAAPAGSEVTPSPVVAPSPEATPIAVAEPPAPPSTEPSAPPEKEASPPPEQHPTPPPEPSPTTTPEH